MHADIIQENNLTHTNQPKHFAKFRGCIHVLQAKMQSGVT